MLEQTVLRESDVKKKFQIPSELSQVRPASEKVMSLLKPFSLGEAALFDIRLCLEEALINAMKYGNRLKADVPVGLSVECDESELRIRVDDNGEGFDVKKLPDCTKGEEAMRGHGRGVFLIHQLMDRVQYNEKGNSLLMVKRMAGSKTRN